MDDPFAVINEECGVISDSQEQLLHDMPFLGEKPVAAQERLELEKATTASPSRRPRDDTNSPSVQLEEDMVSVQGSDEQSTVSESPAAVAVSSPTKSPVNLADVFKLLSRKFVHRSSNESMDILHIAAMKGIDLWQTPRWWRPEGYDEQ